MMPHSVRYLSHPMLSAALTDGGDDDCDQNDDTVIVD